MPTISEIESFLSQVKAAIKSNNYRILNRNYRNMGDMLLLGLSKQDVLDDILGLTVNENWSKEADKDPNFPGDVWKCTKRLHNENMYIKLKIQSSPKGFLLVLSYHISDY